MREWMKKLSCIIAVFIMLTTLTSCWDRKEPKSLALVTSVVYDTDAEKGYHLTLEIRNPSAGGSSMGNKSNQNATVTVSGFGETVAQALRNASVSIERTIFGGQNKARFFSERFAKQEMYGIVDLFARDFLTDERSFIVVVKNDNPRLIYETKISLSEVVGDHIEDLKDNQTRMNSKGVFVSTLKFGQDLLNKGKQPVAGLVSVVPCEDIASRSPQESGGDEQAQQNMTDTRLEYEGLAAFKEGKLVGYFNGIEARAYNFVTNEIKTAYYSANCEDSVIVTSVTGSKNNIKAKKIGDKFKFDMEIYAEMSVIQVDGKIEIMDLDKQRTVEASFAEKIKGEIEDAVKKAQTEFKSDIFGFGSYIHSQHPKEWKNIKDKWVDMFSESEISVKVNCNIKYTGDILSPVEKEVSEG